MYFFNSPFERACLQALGRLGTAALRGSMVLGVWGYGLEFRAVGPDGFFLGLELLSLEFRVGQQSRFCNIHHSRPLCPSRCSHGPTVEGTSSVFWKFTPCPSRNCTLEHQRILGTLNKHFTLRLASRGDICGGL